MRWPRLLRGGSLLGGAPLTLPRPAQGSQQRGPRAPCTRLCSGVESTCYGVQTVLGGRGDGYCPVAPGVPIQVCGLQSLVRLAAVMLAGEG